MTLMLFYDCLFSCSMSKTETFRKPTLSEHYVLVLNFPEVNSDSFTSSIIDLVWCSLMFQSNNAIGQRCRGAAAKGGRGGEGATSSPTPLAPLQPPVCQHEEQVLQRAHAPAK